MNNNTKTILVIIGTVIVVSLLVLVFGGTGGRTAVAPPQRTSVTSTNAQEDPVCGMQVDPATAAGSSEYNGKTYYFCSTHCKQQFDRDPKQFVK